MNAMCVALHVGCTNSQQTWRSDVSWGTRRFLPVLVAALRPFLADRRAAARDFVVYAFDLHRDGKA
jgi:hypothetical protein